MIRTQREAGEEKENCKSQRKHFRRLEEFILYTATAVDYTLQGIKYFTIN